MNSSKVEKGILLLADAPLRHRVGLRIRGHPDGDDARRPARRRLPAQRRPRRFDCCGLFPPPQLQLRRQGFEGRPHLRPEDTRLGGERQCGAGPVLRLPQHRTCLAVHPGPGPGRLHSSRRAGHLPFPGDRTGALPGAAQGRRAGEVRHRQGEAEEAGGVQSTAVLIAPRKVWQGGQPLRARGQVRLAGHTRNCHHSPGGGGPRRLRMAPARTHGRPSRALLRLSGDAAQGRGVRAKGRRREGGPVLLDPRERPGQRRRPPLHDIHRGGRDEDLQLHTARGDARQARRRPYSE